MFCMDLNLASIKEQCRCTSQMVYKRVIYFFYNNPSISRCYITHEKLFYLVLLLFVRIFPQLFIKMDLENTQTIVSDCQC